MTRCWLAWIGHLDEAVRDQQPGVRLFVLGRRGESAGTTERGLGRNVERVARVVRRPVLMVTAGFRAPQRVLMAFDGSAVTRRGVEMIAASTLLHGLPIDLLMSGKSRRDGARQLAWAIGALRAAGFCARGDIVPGDAHTVIADAVQERGVDLLIMGAYSHAPWRKLLLSSTTADLLRSANIPTLLLR